MMVSKFLSKVIGLYEIFISIAMLMNVNQFATSIKSLINNDAFMLYVGCITLIMGLLMVVSHNIWQWNWRVLVTIVAWIVLLKGATILLFPHSLDILTMQLVSNFNLIYIIAGLDLLFGILLCYFGFCKKC